MKLKQLSLFLENKPGHLFSACKLLADAGINLECMSLADTEQFGILRIIVRDWEQAKEVFEKNGTTVRVTDVIAVCLDDRPGTLAQLLDVFAGTNINIEYMYGFRSRAGDSATVVLRLDNVDEAISLLNRKHIRILDNSELFPDT